MYIESEKRQVLLEKAFSIKPITPEEFEKFLVSIDGLNFAHSRGVQKMIHRQNFGVGDGWLGLLKSLIKMAIKAGWNKEVAQVKEKWGGLRFYINEGSSEIFDIINQHEGFSHTICEECGMPGRSRHGNWIRTLCDKHYIK